MTEPITGIAIGIGVYGEHLNLAVAELATEVLGFGVMVVGSLPHRELAGADGTCGTATRRRQA